MDPQKGHDLAKLSTCTTCEMAEDFSKLQRKNLHLSNTHFNRKGNYWTAVIYFRARNGTYKRVPQRAQQGIEKTNGGMVFSFPYPNPHIRPI
jgi:hypothetical protein